MSYSSSETSALRHCRVSLFSVQDLTLAVRAEKWTLYVRRSVQCDRLQAHRAKDQVRSTTSDIEECVQAVEDKNRRKERGGVRDK